MYTSQPCPTPEHKVNTIAIELFPFFPPHRLANRYYIVKYGRDSNSHRYLNHDLKWSRSAINGHWTKKEAEEALNKLC